ncbi:GH16580 [Drosophila grimshawi]|uniref:GH16580 n=2 Tax=Drosophila grimshawi TaxID=7222 RepID=B4J1R3_DROGR|nr:GH16580 [Drosophila grimshawi]
MRISFVTLFAFLALAAADVSHLTSSYLPPPRPEQLEHMSIERHQLRELPEQVFYMHDNGQMADMDMSPSGQLTPPAMPQAEQMLAMRYLPPAEAVQQAMPDTRYLPPAQPAAMPTTRYLPPAQVIQRAQPMPEMEPMPEMMVMPAMEPDTQPQDAPDMRYLPPAQQQAEQPQFIYQQYQQQQQQQLPVQEQQMPYILDVQQPMAPSDAETPTFEAEPAHELRNDGYHYKQAVQEQRLRH